MIRVVSVQIGGVQHFHSQLHGRERSWTSAIVKRPASLPIWVSKLGLVGDAQADTRIHGGIEKALLCYASEHLEHLAASLTVCLEGEVFGPGAFGENLTLRGATEHDVCIEDKFKLGGAIVEVSQPRQPCWKLGLRWKDPLLPMRVQRAGQTGWYLRVLEEGSIQAGDGLTLIERKRASWTIATVNRCLHSKDVSSDLLLELAHVESLPVRWRERLQRKAAGEHMSDDARLFGSE